MCAFMNTELSISYPVFQKCDAMADFSIWFNLRFLKCSFVLNSKFLSICPIYFYYTVYSYFCKFLIFLSEVLYLCNNHETRHENRNEKWIALTDEKQRGFYTNCRYIKNFNTWYERHLISLMPLSIK